MPRGRKKVIIKSIDEQILDTKNRIEDLEQEIDAMKSKLNDLVAKKREQDLATLAQTLDNNGLSVDEAIEIINNAPKSEIEE